ncbi:LmeA family phospholipid-binding protein [Actinomadura sp. WAC 06369]|uniref:LmeA family phospholipid-binding protein n=1 Tax=Actinomadura sp. WAC 06369 TaxID=2203193 RepID=UPI000F78A236|nr:DUF2993 domain-containing protein [Actinomadura sp. WAC 06369]RSN44352.1 DUF2993 domain-containing protein [Actinomadura sp. WAC 06369]
MRKALVVLLVLVVGGLIAADRIGVRVAEGEIARQVAAQEGLARQPDVSIHGFPFLTQAVGGEYDHIEVLIGDYTEQDVTLSGVRVDMRGVRAPLSEIANGNTANVTARTATASAVVPYSVIEERAPKEVEGLAPKGDDLEVDLAGAVMGVRLSGKAVVSLEATDQGIAVTPVSVAPDGGPQIPLALVKRQLTWSVPVTDLPVGSRISRIEPTADGLRVSATARNVQLSDLENVR